MRRLSPGDTDPLVTTPESVWQPRIEAVNNFQLGRWAVVDDQDNTVWMSDRIGALTH